MLHDPWFTVEQIDPTTYAISEYGHWEQVHSYLVLGDRSAALIDTGMGIGNIKTVTDRLTALPIQVVTTHVHLDHIGGHGLYDSIAVHRDDVGWLEGGVPLPPDRVRAWLMRDPLSKPAPPGFDPDAYRPFRGTPGRVLADGDRIDLGNRSLTVLHTPGHSPGHICLYERERGYLFTGDLLYQGKLDAYYPSTDPVHFAQSVERLAGLEPLRQVLPGHYAMPLPGGFVQRAHVAFQELAGKGLLRQGTGIHDFGPLQIHL